MKFQTKEALAQAAIELYLSQRKVLEIRDKDIPRPLTQKAACFVTVYVKGQLRGCIGDTSATSPLYKNIIKNAIRAATEDWRFLQVTKDDLSHLSVEVSVLTPLAAIKPKSEKQFLQFLRKEQPGVVMEKEGRKALFLPQVWQKLTEPKEFLSHLCLKAGLPPDAWQDKQMRYWIFSTRQDI